MPPAAVDRPVVAGSSVAVARSTAVLGIAGTADGFAGVYLHPCKPGPLLQTAYRSAPLSSFHCPALPPQRSPGA